MSKNKKMVQAIVEDMKKYASGDYFLHNGELFPIDERVFSEIPGCTIQQENVLNEVHSLSRVSGGDPAAAPVYTVNISMVLFIKSFQTNHFIPPFSLLLV